MTTKLELTILNLENLFSISVYDKTSSCISFKKEIRRKLWYGKEIITPEGYYGKFTDIKYSEEELEDYLIENDIVYSKPYINLMYQDKKKVIIKFNTLDEAKKWANEASIHINKRLTINK
jgi:hypothetical protein